MDKKFIEKIRSVEALKGKTIADIVLGDAFRENVSKYIAAQLDDRNTVLAYAQSLKRKGIRMKAPAHVIDEFKAQGFADPGRFADEFLLVLAKESTLSAALRKYIHQMGWQAYGKTIIDEVGKQYPEIEKQLLKNKSNEE